MNEFPFLKNNKKKEDELLDESIEPQSGYQDNYSNDMYSDYEPQQNLSFISRHMKTIVWGSAFFVVIVGLVGVFLFTGNSNKVVEADLGSYKDIPLTDNTNVIANNTNSDTIQAFLEQQQSANTPPLQSQVVAADELANQRSADNNSQAQVYNNNSSNPDLLLTEPSNNAVATPKQTTVATPKPFKPATTQTKPASSNNKQVATVNTKPATKPVTKAETRPADSSWSVQLVALSSKAKADAALQDMKTKYPSIFAGKTLYVAEGQSSGKTVYRVRVRSFKNSTEAGNFCKTARADASLQCTVIN